MKLFRLLPLFFLLAFARPGEAQYTVTRHIDPVRAVNQMHDFHDPYAVVVQYAEAPKPGGNPYRAFLREQKLKAAKITPVQPGAHSTWRGSLEKPEILATFSGNNVITGTPLDNHLAVGNEEHVVSAINVHMLVTNATGFWLGSYNLEDFFQNVGTTNRFFDPRVIYDPEQDRFILVLINGSECGDSQIVLAFSQTNNPRGSWNLYALDGCLDDDGTFADYPMISITDEELFLTYNEVDADLSWQEGFMGTQIHQINKMSGYAGEPLERTVWRDIEFNGRLLRNICPVRNADQTLETDQYFLSNRNFDISNDTVFLLHIPGRHDDPDPELTISARLLDHPYGVPPYAVQTRDSLDTNDARVLDAFKLDDDIQWVHNTMDFETGRSGVFHGILRIDEPTEPAKANTIGHPTDYLGYPGIAWTGTQPWEKDAIIVVSHASGVRHPGGSAIYSDGLGAYSDFTSIIEGQRPIDMLLGTVERWGDYIGIQRLYHQPGSVWISCSYGRSAANVNEAWIAKLARVEPSTSVGRDESPTGEVVTYPNPAGDYVQVSITGTQGAKLEALLLDATGRPLQTIKDMRLTYSGEATLTFSTHTLSPGQYYISLLIDGHPVESRAFVRQ